MKQNYKTKYFLKVVLDLAYCAKKSGRDFIFLKTKNLTIPFSLYQIREMSKDCEALTLKKRGGTINEETGKFDANTYSFDFDLLKQLYDNNKCELHNLKKEAESKEIKAKKDVPLLNGKNFTFSAKVRGKYRIESIEQAKQALLDSKYGPLYKKALDDIMIINSTLDEPRKLKFEPNFHLNKNNCISKIGIRATNQLVSAKAHNQDVYNENFHGVFKKDILKQYSLFEFDNSDVSSSVPRLNALYNGIDKWNDVKDYYSKILNRVIELINKERDNDKRIKTIKYMSNNCLRKYISIEFSSNNNYLPIDIPYYHRTTETECFRENIKPLILPAYFDASKGNFIWHLFKAEIEYQKRWNKWNNLPGEQKKKKAEPKRRNTGAALDFWKEWCDYVGISLVFFLDCLFDAIIDVIGELHSNEIFFIESCAYLRVCREIVERGIQVWQVYDCLCTDKKVEDLSELYEKYVNEVVNEMNSNVNDNNNNNDCIETDNDCFNVCRKYISIEFSSNNNYLPIDIKHFDRKKRDESKGRKKRKMTEQTKSILTDKETGMTNKAIAEKYGLTIQRVGQIIKANKVGD